MILRWNGQVTNEHVLYYTICTLRVVYVTEFCKRITSYEVKQISISTGNVKILRVINNAKTQTLFVIRNHIKIRNWYLPKKISSVSYLKTVL